jgi:methionyl-tRNA formyltransferase
MMPKMLFEIPEKGTFNLHASLLPQYRGAAPINFAIINGEKETGATTFFINEKIDEGNILLQDKLNILPDENAGHLHDRLMVLGANLIVKTLDGIAENSISEKPQPEVDEIKNAYKIYKEQLEIDWNLPTNQIHQFVLGMSPYPAAFTNIKIGDDVKSLKILDGTKEMINHTETPGKLKIEKKEFYFYTKDGIYHPKSVQLQGKKMMEVKDFLNGFQNFENISEV